MGDVVHLVVRRRPPSRRVDAVKRTGEIALFTGVRIERWSEERPPEPRDPTCRPPRGRRGR